MFKGSVEQNLPQPFLMLHIVLTGRSGGPRGQRHLVRYLGHSIRLGYVRFCRFFKFYYVRIISGVSFVQ